MRDTTVAVIGFAIAMAYLEAAVVVYLRAALGDATGDVFPLATASRGRPGGWIEIGREAATMVMIAGVGWIAGRSGIERLAWAAVVFGVWDMAYYGWLWVFGGWPSSLGTWDLLFLIPVPWAGPVWAPMLVSLALVGFGLAMAARCRRDGPPVLRARDWVLLLLGGLVVIVAFSLNAGVVLAGEIPADFPWPLFAVGVAVGAVGATRALLGRPMAEPPSRAHPDGVAERG